MSRSKAKPLRAFEDKADRRLRAETRQQRQAYALVDEYDDVFASGDALGADEFWDDDYCEQCHDFHCTVTTWSGERFTVEPCDEED
ncbi:hypothetical protein EF910_05570 [Streptomyces sp. WAC07149]|uniref:hypothetical protein n=1 Tax=Streptomyces sp. WAC07149 TaxID=2487425 RepID=UPI000F7ACA55|nr:hypothetical protein [Streptomyces sp. WAC07149]RST07906.1 hypothetical protein EF910_05570 [Streptomyces sp. WAC07149]